MKSQEKRLPPFAPNFFCAATGQINLNWFVRFHFDWDQPTCCGYRGREPREDYLVTGRDRREFEFSVDIGSRFSHDVIGKKLKEVDVCTEELHKGAGICVS